MTKLSKLYYQNLKGEKKLNCYMINISKEVVDSTDIKDNEVKIYSDNNKIIIEKK